MARKKVKLQWIVSDAMRKSTFKKRKQGLMKKMSELSTLCDVRACAVVYGSQEAGPEVWPSPEVARELLSEYRSMPEMERCKKELSQEAFLRQQVKKLEEQLAKQERTNRELGTMVQLNEGLTGKSLHHLPISAAASLAWTAETKAKAMRERAAALRREMGSSSTDPIPVHEHKAFDGEAAATTSAATAAQPPPYLQDEVGSWLDDCLTLD